MVTVLASLADVLLYAGLLTSIIALALTAMCSYAIAIIGLDLRHKTAIAWPPVMALAMATLEVVLAMQFQYVDHHSHSWMASVVMGWMLVAVMAMSSVVLWARLEIEDEPTDALGGLAPELPPPEK